MDTYKYPVFVKRNARYRGHRESEKYLLGHQEFLFDIHQGWKDIFSTQQLIQKKISDSFCGNQEEFYEILTISEKKIFNYNKNNAKYRLIDLGRVRKYEDIVVKLDGKMLEENQYKTTENGEIIIFQNNEDAEIIVIEFTAIIEVPFQFLFGIDQIKDKIKRLDEQLSELERRYINYENAYF